MRLIHSIDRLTCWYRKRTNNSGRWLYILSLLWMMAIRGNPVLACGGFLDVDCNLHHGGLEPSNIGHQTEKAAQDVGHTAEKAAQDVGHTAEKAAQDVGHTAEKAAQDVGHTAEKAAQDVGHTAEKAAQDTGKTIEKAVQDTGKASETVYKFGVREIQSIEESAKDANRRIIEGKFVDAIWHLSTDHIKHTEENAGKAAQESELVRVAGQIAASAYGGPGGAAAYAAWLTYNQTGDVELALRVGAITGAAAYGSAAVSSIPNENASVIAQKTIAAGAIGGVAVAASGGDEKSIREGFLKGGGAVLVQSIYEVETNHKLDARISKGDAYCMASVDPSAACAPPVEAYKVGPDGKPVIGNDGLPQVDVRKTDPLRPHVGMWAKSDSAPIIGTTETSKFMITISKYPGMNAMALLHDHVSYSMEFDPITNVLTIVPATVITYYGTDTPTQDQIRRSAKTQETGN